jgi:GNAT superfamily N-acetyltransferase
MPGVTIVDDARRLAEQAHAGQTRKGSDRPYIHHPAEVAAGVAANGGADEVVAAAWLHDVVEDTERSLDDVRAATCDRVAALVAAVTEPEKGVSWEERKRHSLARLAAADEDVALLKGSDTLANAREIVRNANDGEDVWARFNRPRTKQLWWYLSVARLVRDRLPGHPLAGELARAVDEVCLIALRPAGEADLDAVLELVEELFAPPSSRASSYAPQEARERARWWLGDGRLLLVADDDQGRPAGYVAAAVDIESIRFGRRAWVEDLVTSPAVRRLGYGAALLAGTRAWARERGCSHLVLTTSLARTGSHAFYDREGGSFASRAYRWALD